MKKYLLTLFTGLLMFMGVTLVNAEEKVLRINLFDYDKLEDMSEIESRGFFLISEGTDKFNQECTADDATQTTTCEGTVDGKLFYRGTYDDSYTFISEELLLDDFTVDDNIEFVITDEIRQNNGQGQFFYPVMEYDKVVLCFAEPKEVRIKNIELLEKSGMAVINSPATANGLNIDVDVKFKDVNDKVIYKVTLKNNTDKDYYINKGNINSSDEYIKYEFSFDNENEIITAGSEKILTLTLTYAKEVPASKLTNGSFESTQTIGVKLSTEKEETIANPKTMDKVMTSIMVLVVSVILLIVMIKVKSLRKAMLVVLALVIVLPSVAKAIEELNVTINTNVKITTRPSFAVYTSPTEVSYYEYEEGMTWEEFYESEYNYDNIGVFAYGSDEYMRCEANKYSPITIVPTFETGLQNNADQALPIYGTRIAKVDPCDQYLNGQVNYSDVIEDLNTINYIGNKNLVD